MNHAIESIDHYDLIARPDWKARSVLVVSPYVEEKFFGYIVEKIKPKNLTVVIDDGCRAEDVDMIRALARRGTKVHVVLGGASGLVHAKLFHIEWLTTGKKTSHTLIYGSGNATRQAFNGNINAEIMCKVKITATNNADVLHWLMQIREAASGKKFPIKIDPVRDAALAKGVSIRLPGFTLRDIGNKSSNFNLWLQRGHLVSEFSPDPSFLRINVRLDKELPIGDEERNLQILGFETFRTKNLSIRYLQNLQIEENIYKNEDEYGRWRSRLFVSTHLGDWCSDACFQANEKIFRKAGYKGREENLKILNSLREPNLKEDACSGFLDSMARLWHAFGSQASTYLRAKGSGFDEDFYRAEFEKRIAYDLSLADDEEFVKRYVYGYEIVDVPRFRMDFKAWSLFVESFCREMIQISRKRRI